MDTTIEIRGQQVSVEVNSNYRVVMSFEREEIITYQQFLNLMEVWPTIEDALFINKTFVQKRDVRMIEPTVSATAQQQAAREQQQKEKQAIEREKEEIVRKVQEHRAEYLRSKGDDRTLFAVMQDTALLREIAADFEAKYPELARRRDELTEIA